MGRTYACSTNRIRPSSANKISEPSKQNGAGGRGGEGRRGPAPHLQRMYVGEIIPAPVHRDLLFPVVKGPCYVHLTPTVFPPENGRHQLHRRVSRGEACDKGSRREGVWRHDETHEGLVG